MLLLIKLFSRFLSPNATKRVRLAAAYTVAARAVLSEINTGTTEQDHYEAFKVYMNWKHVRQKRAATIIQRFYRRRRLREEFKLINVSRHQITGIITLVYVRSSLLIRVNHIQIKQRTIYI